MSTVGMATVPAVIVREQDWVLKTLRFNLQLSTLKVMKFSKLNWMPQRQRCTWCNQNRKPEKKEPQKVI